MKLSLFPIVSLFIIINCFLITPASSTDWTFYNPTGVGYTDRGNGQDTFMITGNNASTGYIDSWHLSAIPGGTQGERRMEHATGILYAMADPTTPNRVFFTDEAGNVGYFDVAVIDYSLGFYNEVLGVCTNCNPMYRISTVAGTTIGLKLTIDSSGNVYTDNGVAIIKHVKLLGYTPQTFYTIVSGTDYTPGNQATLGAKIISLQTDSSDNIHVLIGSTSTGASGARSGYLSYTVINSAGNRVKSDLGILIDTYGAATVAGFTIGGLVIDKINPNQNYSYTTTGINSGSAVLNHNSSTGTQTIAILTGITAITDINYKDNQIYLVSPGANLIRSYVTNYEGYGYTSTGGSGTISGITGTFIWVNGYQGQIITLTPGQALSYMFTISGDRENYSYYTGWGSNTATEPQDLYDLTELTGKTTPQTFATLSNTIAGTDIYGYLIAKNKTTNLWYRVVLPVKLTISRVGVGYDSIIPDKAFYNLTGDTANVALTYGGISYIYFYQWMLCERIDCADKDVWGGVSLVGRPASSSMVTTGMKQGNYYIVLMRHLPLLSNEIVATNYIQIRPPVIGVSWDQSSYNLFPKSQSSACIDATPSNNPWSNISGYAGLQRGWFSCSVTPAGSNANNSIMRGSLYAKYTGTFYLNNSLGNVWNGTLSNGSGALIYTLTNSSVTETWTLVGVNQSGETFYAVTEVVPESSWGYSLSVSPNPAYNLDTLYMTFTKPIWIDDYVVVKDAGGTIVFTSGKGQTSGTYYIDPNKEYTYGTWTAYWVLGEIGTVNKQGQDIFVFTVKNSAKPIIVPNTLPEDKGLESQTTYFLESGMLPAFLMIMLFAGTGMMMGGFSGSVIGFGGGFLFAAIFGFIPIWAVFLFAILIITAFAVMVSGKLGGGGQ